MIAKFTLLLAASSTVHSLPIFSGLFSPRAAAPAAEPHQRRDLNSTQFAQGTNFFFGSLLLESECTPGQVACIGGKTATCSAEANWEVTPCSEGTSCFAIPASSNATDDAVVVKCMTQDQATSIFGTTDISQDFQITAAPFNSTLTPDPEESNSSSSDVPSATDSTSDVPSATDSNTDAPTPSPSGDDNDGENCPEDPEPTETEYITVIAIPEDGQDEFSYSTMFPSTTDTSTATPTDPSASDSTPSATDGVVQVPSAEDCTGTMYQPTEATTCDDVAALYGLTSDVVASNNQFVDCSNIWAYTVLCLPDGTSDPAPSDSTTDVPAPSDADPTPSDSSSDSAPTTLSVPPALASPSTPLNVVPVPEVSIVDTHNIPAQPSSSAFVPPANLKMKKVRRF